MYKEKLIKVKRVTQVLKGGKKITFCALIIISNSQHKVGIGLGKGQNLVLAKEKAVINGKKNLITIPLTNSYSIPHVIKASYGASRIILKPAPLGTGIVAGGSVRAILELSGIKNVFAKQFGSKNLLNNAKATILALIELNQIIELGKSQSHKKKIFYLKKMKKISNT
jgi:small subunit ribosomal protein S5